MSLALILLFSLQLPDAPAPIPYRPNAIPTRRIDWLTREDFAADLVETAAAAFTARLDVTPDGTVDECTVTKSSGQPPFDARACAVLVKRARFRPALDETNAPKPSAYTYRLPWAAVSKPIPRAEFFSGDDYPSRALREGLTGRSVILGMVEADGRVSDCVMQQSSGHAELDEAACRAMVRKGRFAPALDADGKAVASTYATAINWRIPG